MKATDIFFTASEDATTNKIHSTVEQFGLLMVRQGIQTRFKIQSIISIFTPLGTIVSFVPDMAKNYVAFSVFVIRIERVFLAKKKNCIPFNMLVYSNCKLPSGFQVLTPYINSSLCVRKCVSIPKHTRSQKIENVIKIGEWKIFLKVEFDGEIYILCAFQFYSKNLLDIRMHPK